MRIIINSQETLIPDNINTVSKLLEFQNIPEEGTGVGLNNRLIEARNRPTTLLQNGDNVIIISATFGG
ncbi:MAG: sulfur carrier protein ThiS [Muribaculaceae bacterium]|nr:sulfur carrier protein ThiS [Muribaculaceae bacterium]